MFAVGEHTLLKRCLHLTVRKHYPKAQSVIDRFDAEIAKMLRDGSYNKLLEVTWVEVDVDSFERSYADIDATDAVIVCRDCLP